MKSAPVTPDENARITTLYGYDILDTDAEEVFDDITQLASEICETPIALISLIDPKRQWFKSTVGIDAQETSRDFAFCAHAIHEREIFEINDASKDERFFDNPLVTEDPNIKFYAGAQLIAPNGCAIGTLCVISDQTKALTVHQRKALDILSKSVISQMELRKSLLLAKAESSFKTEFLSSMSHEIRTPLNAIVGFSQILLENINAYNIPKEGIDYIKDIDFSSQHLLGIVNSVLDLSKIEAGEMGVNKDWFNTQCFITNIVHMMCMKADKKGITLLSNIDKKIPDYFYLDEGKLSQILINIINNSIKYTGSNKQIFFNVLYNQSQLTFVIKDEGVGIDLLDQANLFSKFKQVGHQKQEGTGLGLTISKKLTELMEGQLILDSTPLEGATVTINISLDDIEIPEKIRVQPKEKVLEINSNLKILVVEDNPINRKIAHVIFKSIGYIVEFATDGEQSLLMAETNQYDVIFMDIHMPGISGIEAAEYIRSKNSEVPIIALTADVFAIQNRDSNIFKFDGYVSKPIIKNVLQDILKKVLSH